jgi:hypothetical protein
MLWRKKQQEEKTPWYRRRDYKGNLTEDEKRELDALRWSAQQSGGKHPAAEYGDLPNEVQAYISKLEIELNDERGAVLMGRVLVASGIGAFIVASYFGWSAPNNHGSTLSLLGGLLLFVVAWFYYFWEEKKLRNDFWAGGASERIRSEWELEYVVSKKMKK